MVIRLHLSQLDVRVGSIIVVLPDSADVGSPVIDDMASINNFMSTSGHVLHHDEHDNDMV